MNRTKHAKEPQVPLQNLFGVTKKKCIAQHGDSIDLDVQEKTASYKEYALTHFSRLLKV